MTGAYWRHPEWARATPLPATAHLARAASGRVEAVAFRGLSHGRFSKMSIIGAIRNVVKYAIISGWTTKPSEMNTAHDTIIAHKMLMLWIVSRMSAGPRHVVPLAPCSTTSEAGR